MLSFARLLKQTNRRVNHCRAATALLVCLGLFGTATVQAHDFSVLVFSETAGFRHDSITNGIAAIRMLGTNNDFEVDASEDASVFNDANLSNYQAVIFLSTTGDILNANQQDAFERYIKNGGGFVGIHSASDTEYSWPWYGGLVGAYFSSHPAGTPTATVKVADRINPSTASLPKRWIRTDEWYNFQTNPRGNVHVLATLDETTYSGGTMGFDHPIAWCHDYDGGRAWYTAGGHTPESYSDPLFLQHLLGGIEYAVGEVSVDTGVTIDTNYQKVILDASPSNPMELAVAPDGRVFYVERGGKLKIFLPQSSSVVLAAQLAIFSQIEDGLLGIALDPGFATNNWIYLYYSPAGATPEQHLSRFTMVGNSLDLSSEKVLLVIPTQRDECCHSGGCLVFGPSGNLFLSVGDNTNPFESDSYAPIDERPGRSSWDAQRSAGNANDLRGKILRIHPEPNGTYTIPSGNLFPSNGSAGKPEIYVMGDRNPFRISVDSANGWLYWGEVGPDAGADNPLRGPKGYDEWNQARSAGNYGWPYFVGNNKPYIDYNFATSNSTTAFNPAAPVNNSPNNTGSVNLPPARPAWIWYPYDDSPEFPEINGSGGRTAMGGPVYHYQTNLYSPRKLPAYYDNTVFIYEWSRNFIKEVKLDDNGDILKINPFLPTFTFTRPMDMKIGPDGMIYMIEWGTGFGGDNPDAKIIRIEYTGGNNRSPVAVISATPTSGSAPLQVQFSSTDTYDPDPDGPLTYEWSFFGDGTINSTNANPAFTYTTNGNYTAQLKVSDTLGNLGFASVTVTVGNHRPMVQINWPPNGGVFDWNKPFSYSGQVFDTEDGSTTNGSINCSSFSWDLNIGHNDHSHGDSHANACEGLFEAPAAHGGDGDNVFLVVRASYSDLGAAPAGSLTGEAVDILQPRRKEAENFTHQNGTTNTATGDIGGGHDVVGIDHGDYISFFPVNLTNITALTFRVAATAPGGQIEVRLDSPAGTLLGTAAVPNSVGNYTNVTVSVADPGGTHELYLVFTRSPQATDLFKLNWMEFVGDGVSLNQTPYGGTPHPIPGTIQVEDFDSGGEGVAYHDTDTANNGNQYRTSGVDIENCSDTGGGYNVGWAAEGEWLEYTVDVATPGLYRMDTRYAAYGGGVFHLESDGINKTGPITNLNTGGWQNWQTLAKSNVALSAGQQVLRLAMDKNGGGGFVENLNYLTFTLLASNHPPSIALTNPGNGAAFSAPGAITLKASASDLDGSVSKVEFFAGNNLIGADSSSPFSMIWTNSTVGVYLLTARATDNVGLTTVSDPVSVTVINGQAPFYGLPQTIPGIIQAEDFDGGGEGVAYHDGDASNNGNQYRDTFVDVENAGDVGGGYDVGFTGTGEWLKYSVTATISGIYSIGTRIASQGNAGTYHLEIDGQNVTGSVTVNDTGGWQIYQTLTKTNVSINAGPHEVKLSLDSTGANGTAGNYNYFIFTATSTNPPPVFLQSTASVPGPFADDNAAVVNTTTKVITIPISTSTRFYRLHSSGPTKILSVQIVGTNVVMTYQ
ncbi:MAG: ThuA domain-containing protein [Limisphaerales bacterium]